MQETWVQSLGWEDLEKGKATHSIILAWRTCVIRGAWWATVHGVTKDQTLNVYQKLFSKVFVPFHIPISNISVLQLLYKFTNTQYYQA